MFKKLLSKIYREKQRSSVLTLLIGIFEYMFIYTISIFPRLYWKVAPKYYRFRASNDVHQYSHPPDIFKIEFADPERIMYRTGRANRNSNRRLLFGKVLDGDWDKTGKRISKTQKYTSLKNHFDHGTPWRKTGLYQKLVENVDSYSSKYNSEQEILEQLYEYDRLYDRIRADGYKMQMDIIDKDTAFNKGLYLDTLDEVTVDVGRDGELLRVDGSHRLIIAKLLDLDQIPVVFLVRHKEWMEYREKIAEGKEIPDHPDLRDIK